MYLAFLFLYLESSSKEEIKDFLNDDENLPKSSDTGKNDFYLIHVICFKVELEK